MKIEKLRLKNLNSLYGEWEIDFNHQAYRNEGIFAITGATGTGKSTLLDALCLALYGETPRLGKISQSTNGLLSRGKAECFAELSFSAGGKRYRSFWGQHRARKDPRGNLIAPVHELSRGDSGEILSEKKRDTLLMIEEITGMDFDRFTKSMLLAQGGFDAFLKAQPDKRSDILEQITGTELYSRISVAVHQRNRSEKEKLLQLNAGMEESELLTEEEVALLQDTLSGLERQERELQEQLKSLEKKTALLKEEEELQQQQSKTRQELDSLMMKQKESISSRELLEKSNRAEKLKAHHSRWKTSQRQVSQEQQKQLDLLKQKPRLEQQLREIHKRLDQEQQELDELRKDFQDSAELWKDVRRQDTLIQEKNLALNNLRQRAEEKKKQMEAMADQLRVLSANQQNIIISLNQLKETIGEKEGPDLAAALPGIQEQWKYRQNRKGLIEKEKVQLLKLQNQLQQGQQKEEERARSLREGQALLDREERKWKEMDQAHQQLLGQKSIERFREELKHSREKEDLLKVISLMEDQRKKLSDGNPCPLCGSLDHPYALGNIPQLSQEENTQRNLELQIEKLEQQQKDLDEQQRKIGDHKNILNNLISQQEQESQNLQDYAQGIKEAKEALEERYKEEEESDLFLSRQLESLGFSSDLLKQEMNIPEYLEEQLLGRQHLLLERKELEMELEEINQKQYQLQGRLESLQERDSEEEQSLLQQQMELDILQNDRKKRFGNEDPEAAESRLSVKLSQKESLCHQQRESLSALQQQKQGLDSSLDWSQRNLEELSQEESRYQQQFLEEMASQGFHKEQDFLGACLPVEDQEKLRQNLQELDRMQNILEDRLQELHQRLVRNKESLPQESRESLVRKINQQTDQLKELRENRGGQKLRFHRHLEAVQRQKDKKEELEKQNIECRRWDKLHQLIGSADGKKYRNFAQGLTFERMVIQANHQLGKMNDRYLLVRDEVEPLELNVMDNYQAGEIRSTRNLSGGESFIVSLALALGLSGMAGSKVPLESLFLDEGFGTLDEDSLETALTALSELQQQGKMIGIISHVPALKDRIATQIKISALPGGRSRMEGPGCRTLGD